MIAAETQPTAPAGWQNLEIVGGDFHGLRWYCRRWIAAGDQIVIGWQLYRCFPNEDGELQLVHDNDTDLERVDL